MCRGFVLPAQRLVSAPVDLVSLARNGMLELARPGESELSGRTLVRASYVVLPLVIVVANLIGACAVLVIAAWVVPEPRPAHIAHVRLVNALVAAGYVAFAVPLGVFIGTRGLLKPRRWLLEERPPTLHETRILLHAPLRLFVLQVSLWLCAALLFSLLNLTYSTQLAIRVAIIVSLTGFVTAACAYLLTERVLRSGAARALKYGTPGHLAVPGITTRALLAWALGTALPVGGLAAVGILALAGDRTITVQNLGVAVVVLCATGIVVGCLAVTLAARATADPVKAVRRALARVQRGDFDVRIPVYDGSEVGQLQLGFNEMVAGLAERERIREAFGTYVDPDVAERILEEGVDLSGEQVEVTCMFIDIRNFTGFAEKNSAPEVVAAINRLFERVVPIIHAHGGRVDKFIGDGLLAVFGAPRRQPDHAEEAFAAALEVADAIADAGDVSIGIGLNSGPVVAGNVGGAGRYEFSVIGDTVNVAARVEAATRQTGDTVLISERTRELLSTEPALVEREHVVLKGKQDTVRVYAPGAVMPDGGRSSGRGSRRHGC